jgi:2-haloacid dehalogenase
MFRRQFLAMPVVAGGYAALSAAGGNFTLQSKSGTFMGVKALVFDTFGTVVDWRGSIIREGEQWGKEKNIQIDWGKFADRWRAGYGPSMDKVRKGELPWMKLDALHRTLLENLLTEFDITGLTEPEKEHWNNVWHRLYGWPDSVEGLTLLKKKYIIATLSNGNVSLLVEMAKFAGLPWDTVFGSDLFHHFKPDREVYLGAVDLLSCQPGEVMMVAAHPPDLNAARACGLKTGLVPRPQEMGPNAHAPAGTAANQSNSFDVVAKDFIELAAKLN